MEDHEKFREWVTERGVKITNITAHKFEGRGVGIIAEKRLEVRGIATYLSIHFIMFHPIVQLIPPISLQ